jgi:hypothetical protein
MKGLRKMAGLGLPGLLALMGFFCSPAAAQDPVITPIIVDTAVNTAVPIVVKALKPKPSKWAKFQGTVMHANIAQITARAKGNDLGIQTFPLSEKVSAKMQQIIDRGGYQYGDKVTIFYDPANMQAMNIKGKPSKPI